MIVYMRRAKYIIWFLIVAISSFVTSCADYLDKAPEEDLTIEEAFRQRKYAEGFLMGAYSDLPFEYMFVEQADINPFVLASDELNVPWPDKFGKLMNRGAMNPYNATGRLWINLYEGIRKANLFLEYIHLTELDKNFTQEDKDVWIGEAILLRALYHYYVVRTYGPCVILDRVMMPNDDFMQMYRNTLDECVEFILKELDRAIDMLPMQITDRTQLGRVTAAGAYAVKARLLLYRASDLWNGNPLYKDFTDSRGVHLFPQEKDPVWWERAAEAHLECITACEKAGYKLYRDPSNDPIANYSNLFIEDFNCEALMYYNFGNTSWGESCSFPRTLGGWAGYNPTQAQVDAYEMADGTIPITGYNADGSPIINPESNYTEVGFAMEDDPQGRWKAGVSNMYVNRDPRFYATINFNGAVFKDHQIQLWNTGADGLAGAGRDYCTTGYLLRKHADPNVNLLLGHLTRKTWALFRLGEVYLGYAEALNEAEGPVDDVYKYVNLIRDRAGMPALPEGLTKEQMRDRIRRERRVELCYETHRYFDCHRWMIAHETEGGPVYGMNIAAGESLSDPAFYKRTLVETRVFPYPQYYLFPIMQEEIDKVPTLVQNPYWL